LASFVSLRDIFHKMYPKFSASILNNFSSSSYYTFLLLPKGFRVQTIRDNPPSFLEKYLGKDNSETTRLLLQPLSDVHFNTTFLFDFPNKGDIRYDYILSGIALFILLIACVNFINISTARSATRAKEIGMRKVLGSNRSRLVWQFILEFALLGIISAVLAIVLVELLLPVFNSLAGKQLALNFFSNSRIAVSFLAIWLSVVFLACAYPSIYLSSLQPAAVIKGIFRSGTKGSFIRKSLIVFQFVISVFLIVVSGVMWRQYYFLKSHKLGFDVQQVVFTPFNAEIGKNYNAFRAQLLQNSDIRYVSIANWVPGDAKDIEGYSWQGKSAPKSGSFYSLIVDPDFAKTLGLKFAAGRNFSWQMPSDWSDGYILNETAAKMMGWTPAEAIGQPLKSYHHNGHVIGVIKDFNFRSLRHGIEPIVMLMDSSQPHFGTLIKISSHNIPGTISYMQSTWKQFSPDFPFDYHFLDQSFDQLYRSEKRLNEIFGTFSMLAILIACLGLFGLAAYATQERTKEMGIRKVLGASVPQVVNLIASDFLKLVLIANVIAWPLAYYAMQEWLQNFAYRINIGLWIFVLSGILALVIALLTVSSQAIRAATANPVESLRYE
ncbi:MAG: FtsX-like permease family protein, partial [Bacteroidetes bacterium]|nr:FtsX-like permease family protein [Bacteroidota bacterium]